MNDLREVLIWQAIAGGALATFTDCLKRTLEEFRRESPDAFKKSLDALEREAVHAVENAALEGFSEPEQLFIVERIRAMVRNVFADVRDGHA